MDTIPAAQADDPPQGRLVPLLELVGRGGIGLRNLVRSVLCLAGIWPHESIYISRRVRLESSEARVVASTYRSGRLPIYQRGYRHHHGHRLRYLQPQFSKKLVNAPGYLRFITKQFLELVKRFITKQFLEPVKRWNRCVQPRQSQPPMSGPLESGRTAG
jgi:hypothetical protein